ncbi:His/Glu/Gln/Arg/opine family amino acid ABC transporter permease subunit [Paenibacillus rhizosphaerae]|uniref:His/Glu/Gln/Arg/opine family amino acid ABC transporter permease subunit n=1 Tax=Paenibacillus rhizosphaerae TaxID=297318 RepID=A0A839TGC1_9BACL|nr:His/Glu/Gln/Arg/opine family amino acid ABC transporter permease subunit [Paenibacillus rhizosphaerae]
MNDRTAHLTDIFIDSFVPLLMAGIKFTIPLTIISFILGFVLAFLTALARLTRWSILQRVAWFYVWIIRGTPLLVQLFIIFYGLPSVGVVIDAFTAAVIGFSISVGAYGSEIIRPRSSPSPRGSGGGVLRSA